MRTGRKINFFKLLHYNLLGLFGAVTNWRMSISQLPVGQNGYGYAAIAQMFYSREDKAQRVLCLSVNRGKLVNLHEQTILGEFLLKIYLADLSFGTLAFGELS